MPYITPKKLRKTFEELKALDPYVCRIWYDRDERQWMGNEKMIDVNPRGEEYEFLHEFELGENTNEAYEELQRHIEKMKAKKEGKQ